MYKSSLLIVMIGLSLSVFSQKNYESEWKEVRYLSERGLPQSALKIVDSIYQDSKTDNNAPQFLKAALYQVKLRADYQEDYMESSISQINSEIASAVTPIAEVLHSIQAEMYWRYYQGNRHKFLDRTAVSNPDPNDIRTWDTKTLVQAVADHYRASLDHTSQLQAIKLESFDPILETATGSKDYRPTLYDFLAHRAFDFFKNDEAGVIKPARGFLMDSPGYYAQADDFTKLTLLSENKEDFCYNALILMQELIRFHLNDKDAGSLIDTDLERIKFVNEKSILDRSSELYLEALQKLQNAFPNDLHSAAVAFEIALEHQRRGLEYNPVKSDTNRWEMKKAREVCEQAISQYPGSNGANNCSVLLKEITSPFLQTDLHFGNLPEMPFLGSINYKNISKVYFRIVKFNPEEDRQLREKERSETILARYKSLTPVKQWNINLPDEGDHQPHRAEFRMPTLPKGYYILLASDNPDFSTLDQSVTYASFWISRISYITRNDQKDGRMEIFVLDRDKGTPLKGLKADAYSREYNYQSRSYTNKLTGSYTTDDNGYIAIPSQGNNSRSFYLQFSLADDLFYSDNYFYLYPAQPEDKSRVTTYFFTDRSIYRPGQTVYFKGIVLDVTGDKSEIKPDFTTIVAFYDANYQKVSELALTTNEFGSINGTFTAPTGGLTGEMTIRNESGNVSFSVEEYKRPRFKVEMDAPEGSYKINETVTLTGSAMNYNSAPIDQAEVSYRVVRTARFPFWRSWWNWFPTVPETEITSGTAVTGADGSFSLSFKAIPDYKVEKKYQPVFNYKVFVDVTDKTGEVHSGETSISVSYQAMVVSLDIPEQVNLSAKPSFNLKTTNLNGQAVKASGTLTLYLMDAPEIVLRERTWPNPDVFIIQEDEFHQNFPNDLYDRENDPETWTKMDMLFEKAFDSSIDTIITLDSSEFMTEGEYLLILETSDAFGEKIEMKQYFTGFNPGRKAMPGNEPLWHVMLKNSGEPGETAGILVGSAENNARVLYEIENDGGIIDRQWLTLTGMKTRLDVPIKEEYRGDFFINLTLVKGNRSYQVVEKVAVPFTNKELKITAETFRDKLTPGKDEEWKLRITGMNGEKVAAELLASMYDASLDTFRDHNWYFSLYSKRYGRWNWNIANAFTDKSSEYLTDRTRTDESIIYQDYDRLNWFGFEYARPFMRVGGLYSKAMGNAVMAMDETASGDIVEEKSLESAPSPDFEGQLPPATPKTPDQPLRKNFNETAFFFPAMQTDENGDVILKFTVPESLTAWKMMALAFTKDLKTGMLIKDAVSRKDLMVMTNAPRFFREGDRIFFSAKLVSLADKKLEGYIEAEFFDAYTMEYIEKTAGTQVHQEYFSLEQGSSRAFAWELEIPEGINAIVCRVKASSGEFSDGEEVVVPVLSNRILVTETMPMPVSRKGTKNFKFEKLLGSATSTTINNYRLTLEFTSNPAWYAVQALPYLTETTHESADGIFARYYANTLASWIANSNPKIKQVFENWKNLTPDALLSNLEKNQELKSVLLNETPWVLEARSETERKQRIALLFDLNRMAMEQQSALSKLKVLQSPNGGWSWFEGMPDNRYITQQIVTGIGKLQHLGVIELQREPEVISMVQKAFRYLDDRIREDYAYVLEHNKDRKNENHLGVMQVQYLYAYSYLADFVKLNPNTSEAFDYYKGQAAKYWTEQNKYIQAMIAVALSRMEVTDVPQDIIKSLKENALHSDELGMYWREPEGYFWYEAPIERQAMLIEAFSEATDDPGSVEEMKIWLLKQKQTQDWKTSRATADAVYALLLRGTDLLASDQLVEVTLGEEKIDPMNLDGVVVEAGTGYFQVTKSDEEIMPEMGNVKVVKKDEGVAWGAVYWQYFEDLDRITPAESPLSIERELYVEKNTPSGPVLDPVSANMVLKTGDKLVSRVIIRVDRDMEYVHMKDMRAAAFEPVNSLSGYRYQGGLGYYESIRDASVNFYFDYLRKGTYVFEYKLNATQKGKFSNGITSIQCLYAPEFAAHSQGVRVTVE